jgi:hypothetical protein
VYEILMTSERVGFGIFGWSGTERRTDRYGGFVLNQATFEGADRVAAHLDNKALEPLIGKRVHIWCKVITNRESGHAGDLFLGILPTKPEIGEVVDLGVGTLDLEWGFEGLTAVVLRPGDGRDTFWYNPHKLYRLHDQTVEVFIEATDLPFTEAPALKKQTEPMTIDNGDGSFQTKGIKDGQPFRIEPTITKLGDGLFTIEQPSGMERGKHRKVNLGN